MQVHLNVLLFFVISLISCDSKEIVEPITIVNNIECSGLNCNLGIRLINSTAQIFHKIEFEYRKDDQHETFTYFNLNAGDTTEYYYIEKMVYHYYTSAGPIYFGRNYMANLGNREEEIYSGPGFCWTGIISDEIDDGHYSIRIRKSPDPSYKYEACQKKDK